MYREPSSFLVPVHLQELSISICVAGGEGMLRNTKHTLGNLPEDMAGVSDWCHACVPVLSGGCEIVTEVGDWDES